MSSKNKRWINHKSRTLSVSATCMQQMQESVAAKQKIKTIKLLRQETNCGLREAKLAVEAHFPEYRHHAANASSEAYRIVPRFRIKEFTIETHSGPVKVDLEGMQMHALMHMETIGIDECQRILELVTTIKEWAEGHGVGTEDDEDSEDS